MADYQEIMAKPEQELEKLMSQFRSDAGNIAGSVASTVADLLVLPLKAPMAGVKAIATAVAQAPAPPALPGLPGIPDPRKAFGVKGVDQPREDSPMFPSWTGAGKAEEEAKGELSYLAGEVAF